MKSLQIDIWFMDHVALQIARRRVANVAKVFLIPVNGLKVILGQVGVGSNIAQNHSSNI